jgi:hypothetical protein
MYIWGALITLCQYAILCVSVLNLILGYWIGLIQLILGILLNRFFIMVAKQLQLGTLGNPIVNGPFISLFLMMIANPVLTFFLLRWTLRTALL